MASRPNHYKLLQQLRGFAEVTNRRPPPHATSGLWASTRPPILHPVRFRLRLVVSATETDSTPRPVKITFVA